MEAKNRRISFITRSAGDCFLGFSGSRDDLHQATIESLVVHDADFAESALKANALRLFNSAVDLAC